MMKLFVKDRKELRDIEELIGHSVKIPTVFLTERRAYGWFLLEYPATPALIDEERGIIICGNEAVEVLRKIVKEEGDR